jgi:hypothetical protein
MAMQMFDMLGEGQPDKPFSRQVLHIASGQPDGAEHPSFNDNWQLDDVTWESMPHEMRKVRYPRTLHLPSSNTQKRNIGWNLICLQNIPRLVQARQVSLYYVCR